MFIKPERGLGIGAHVRSYLRPVKVEVIEKLGRCKEVIVVGSGSIVVTLSMITWPIFYPRPQSDGPKLRIMVLNNRHTGIRSTNW